MLLSKQNIGHLHSDIEKPDIAYFELPEKVLQFGTGVLLRGLPDYYIDKANKHHVFNGRIVVVKSTANGDTDSFSAQDNLFTHHIRGIENGIKKESVIVNASISRVLSATGNWDQVLQLASSPSLQIILSNTTEVGIKLHPEDNITSTPPLSFPGKLVAFLYERYKAFNGSADSGLVIIPTELITNNGSTLQTICCRLAELNKLDTDFINWMTSANDFCNSLVDRIVPGSLSEKEAAQAEEQYNCKDNLAILSETYSLWAIETDRPRTRSILSFSTVNPEIVLSDNITKFRNLKLRLLNATHTLACGLALFNSFNTVKDAMNNTQFEAFISTLMDKEIAGAIISNDLTSNEALGFAASVRDRFRNPDIEHQWYSISTQYTSKVAMRVVPLIQAYYRRFNDVPYHIASGFGAYIAFMNTHKTPSGTFVIELKEKKLAINDSKADILHKYWSDDNVYRVVHNILKDEQLWNEDLTQYAGFERAVLQTVKNITEKRSGGIVYENSSLQSI